MAASTATATRAAVADPAYRVFPARVARTARLCPSFVRVTFTSSELDGYGPGGFDQRLKLLLPQGSSVLPAVPEADWYGWWRALPDDVRPTMRTYTVRAFRPQLRELDVDFVLHGVEDGHAGPASSWAAGARSGDEVWLIGPSVPGTGRMWGVEFAPPAEARTVLLAGDETAVPAVCSILEQLDPGLRVTALLEVPHAQDALDVPAGADVRWLPRGTGAAARPHGQLLLEAVREVAGPLLDEVSAPAADFTDVDVDAQLLWEVPEQPAAAGPECLYAWLAGECGVVKELRRHLVRDLAVPKQSVAFMGYWRAGRAEGA
ncbi:siderophore-interacting protein [Kineococcus sp. SYSU DK004]|uniref:siderophore-interacting protein n=1 Tax=Kineococcus sp. SYSU DK004 TaxID=3383125 RepID=UPI003D7C84DF